MSKDPLRLDVDPMTPNATAFCGFELGRMSGLEVPTAFANVARRHERVGERRSAAIARYL